MFLSDLGGQAILNSNIHEFLRHLKANQKICYYWKGNYHTFKKQGHPPPTQYKK